MNNRKYISKYDMAYKNILADMKLNKKPVFVISLETTGLSTFSDEIIKINAIKCHFEDKLLLQDDVYCEYIKNNKLLSPEIESITGITNKQLENAADLYDAMHRFTDFLGDKPNIVGFHLDFVKGMLNLAGFNTGFMINYGDCFDLKDAATACIEVSKSNASLNDLTKNIVKKSTPKTEKILALFNYVSDSLPTGTEIAQFSDNIRFWKKGYNCRYLYIMTDHGEVGLNCNTGFWIERTADFFNIVNMDKLTETACHYADCHNIWEFIKKYAK